MDIGSCAKMLGIMYAFFGLIAGAFMALISIVGGAAGSQGPAGMQSLGAGIGGGLALIVLLPLLYGVAGLIGGAIFALIYNVAARFTGGIKFSTS